MREGDRGTHLKRGRCQVIQVMCRALSGDGQKSRGRLLLPGSGGAVCALPAAARRHLVHVGIARLCAVCDIVGGPAHEVLRPCIEGVLGTASVAAGWEAQVHLRAGQGRQRLAGSAWLIS